MGFFYILFNKFCLFLCNVFHCLSVLSVIVNFANFWEKANKVISNLSGRPALLKGRRKFEFLARLQNNQKVRYSDIPNRATPDCRQCSPPNIGLIYIQWQGQIARWYSCRNQFSRKYFRKGGFTFNRYFQVLLSSWITYYSGHIHYAHYWERGCFYPQAMFYSTWTNFVLIPAGERYI